MHTLAIFSVVNYATSSVEVFGQDNENAVQRVISVSEDPRLVLK